MPLGKRAGILFGGQNKIHFHKYSLMLLLSPIQFLHISVKKGVYCGNTDFHKHVFPNILIRGFSYEYEKMWGTNTPHGNREYLFLKKGFLF